MGRGASATGIYPPWRGGQGLTADPVARVGGWWCTYAQDRTPRFLYIYTPFLLAFSTETRSRSGEIARANLHPWNPWRGPCASLPLDLARANPLFQRGIDVRIVYEACEECKRGYIQVAIGGHDSILHKGE